MGLSSPLLCSELPISLASPTRTHVFTHACTKTRRRAGKLRLVCVGKDEKAVALAGYPDPLFPQEGLRPLPTPWFEPVAQKAAPSSDRVQVQGGGVSLGLDQEAGTVTTIAEGASGKRLSGWLAGFQYRDAKAEKRLFPTSEPMRRVADVWTWREKLDRSPVSRADKP